MSNIIEIENITHNSLQMLINREVDVVRIENYYNPILSEEISDKFLESRLSDTYVNAPLIGRVGQAYFEGCSSEKSRLNYSQNATLWIRELRDFFHPILIPNDKLRLDLDVAWSEGCTLANIDGNKAFSGLVRHFNKSSYAEPHNDVLARDLPLGVTTDITNQLAANIYLKTPKRGGELILWDMWPSQKEYENIRKNDSYGVDSSYLPDSKIVIQPKVGELILFNPMRIHAVSEILEGSRITSSTFIGYENKNSQLYVWS